MKDFDGVNSVQEPLFCFTIGYDVDTVYDTDTFRRTHHITPLWPRKQTHYSGQTSHSCGDDIVAGFLCAFFGVVGVVFKCAN